jgi:hypothetical protein
MGIQLRFVLRAKFLPCEIITCEGAILVLHLTEIFPAISMFYSLGFGDDASFSQVNNTDAEGRLTLADALVYAGQLKVDKVLSLLFSTHP